MRELLGYQRNQPLEKAVEELKSSHLESEPNFAAAGVNREVSDWDAAFNADFADKNKEAVGFPLGESVSQAYAESSL
jgi:hypothetical protein